MRVCSWAITPRIKGICDKLSASLKCTVICPDCLRGKTAASVTCKADFFKWIVEYPWDLLKGDIEACTDFLISKDLFSPDSPTSTMSCIGFCWGVWVVAKTLNSAATAPTTSKWGESMKCGVGLHPSTHVEKNAWKADEDKMIQEITSPLLFLTAGNDPENIKKGSENAAHLEKMGGGSIDYPDMVHGWVARGDLTKEDVKRDNYDALVKTNEFLQKNM